MQLRLLLNLNKMSCDNCGCDASIISIPRGTDGEDGNLIQYNTAKADVGVGNGNDIYNSGNGYDFTITNSSITSYIQGSGEIVIESLGPHTVTAYPKINGVVDSSRPLVSTAPPAYGGYSRITIPVIMSWGLGAPGALVQLHIVSDNGAVNPKLRTANFNYNQI
jgi:hypothetical protein